MIEFEKDKQINPGKLDMEAVRQAEVFFKWAEKSIKAKAELDRTELERELTESSLNLKCRENPADFGISKTTVDAVQAAVKKHPDYIKIRLACIEAREHYDLMVAARYAMEHRKRMIEILVTLHGQQYFAGPHVPRDLVAEWQDHQKERTKSVDDRMGKRVRKRSNGDS